MGNLRGGSIETGAWEARRRGWLLRALRVKAPGFSDLGYFGGSWLGG